MTEKRIRYAGIYDTCMIMDWENNEKLNRKDIINRLNEQDKEINTLKSLIIDYENELKELEKELQNLQTFKKILESAEKSMEERADWQAYCEKEFGGL